MRVVLLFLFCVSVVLGLPSCAEVTEDSTKPPRLVAFGDVHGDIVQCRQLLQLAGITDANDQWIAGLSTVIQLGDITDRGRHAHEILDLFASLELQAKAAGGEFTFVMGNHELMNLMGKFWYVHSDVVAAFGGDYEYAVAFSPQGLYGLYIRQHPACLVREGVVFVHGGILPEKAALGVDNLNAKLRKGLQSVNLKSSFKSSGNSELDFFEASDSPLWTRLLFNEAEAGNCTLVTESLRLLSESEVAAGRSPVHVMIVGHTSLPHGAVLNACEGRFIGADVRLSHYMGSGGGHLAYVEFAYDNESGRRVAVPKYPLGQGVRLTAPSVFTRVVQPPSLKKYSQEWLTEEGGEAPSDGVDMPGFITYLFVVCAVLLLWLLRLARETRLTSERLLIRQRVVVCH